VVLEIPPQRALSQRDREIARLTDLYAALSQVNQAIVWTKSREELFERVCRAMVERGRFQMAWIGLHDPLTQRILPATSCGDHDNYLQAIEIFADDRPEGHGPCGKAFREGCPQVRNHLLADREALPWHEQLIKRGWLAVAVFPVRKGRIVYATMTVYAAEAEFFQRREVDLLTEVADALSFALDNLEREQQRRDAEEELIHERDFSDAVLNSLPGVLFLHNRKGKFLRWNRNLEQVSGYNSTEILQMHPLDFSVPADREMLASRIAEVFSQGASEVEADFLCKNGQILPYHFTGVRTVVDGATCLVGVGLDLSAERLSEARYRSLFEYAPNGILIADPQGFYLDANASICQMLGYSRQELMGKSAEQLVVAEETSKIGSALQEVNSGGNHEREWCFKRRDGSTFPAEVMATKMPDGSLLAIVRDVSERKAAQQALLELNLSLELKVVDRTEQLQLALHRAEAADRTKSSFLANMSHELRTPLNSILGFTGILLQQLAGPLNAEQLKQLGMVRKSSRHLVALINDVLDLSKIEADQLEVRRESFDLAALLEQTLGLVRPLAEQKGLALSWEIAPEIDRSVSDQRRVQQILLNLLQNAIKFTESGQVKLTAWQSGQLNIVVQDSGIGMKAEDLSNLFLPFRQLDTGLARQHEGTGLGLAICRRLATLLGGEIQATSQFGSGSVFTLTLPLVERESP